ncbi:hypothetical protein KQX54_018377 [Cotesia glomerata]|uniref:Uncharacterized protein n=1 Tax=Cotesia glomerata TaxID=32391 RepID=A0AAV7J5R0_COTGL|nr:hypothetical protein KQX54_018377 [Cotesia glomerata]
MARQSVIDSFTSDEEISHWVIGDDFIVNNGGNSRICVLFWGDRATQLFGNSSERSIITIKRAKAQKRNSQFHDPEDGVGPIELSTTQVSTIVIENFLFHPRRVPIPPQYQGQSYLVQRRSEDLLQD